MEAQEPVKSFLYDLLLPKVEKIYLLVSVVGGVLFWNHVKGGNTLCIVGLGGLAINCFLLAYKPSISRDEVNFPAHYFGNTYDSSENMPTFFDVLVSKILYITSACTLVGILFKLMFWKGANLQLLAVVLPLMVGIIIQGLKQQINRRAFIIAVLGGFMLFTPYKTIISELYRDDPQLVEAMVYQENHPNDPAALEAYHKRMREYRNRH